ncbi:aconitase family protein [Myxococcota bacterium]|nr:aconitase family protein [Myxococcota bacterium]
MTLQFAVDVLREKGFLDGTYDAVLKANSSKIMFPFDHLVPATDAKSAALMVGLREFAKKYGIRVFEVGYDGGIQHRLFEERGFLYPGTVGVGADSHSCTYGALGCLGTGIGSTDLASAMISGKVWLQVPRSIRVNLTGTLRKGVYGKDVVLHLIGLTGVDGATYQSIEFTGSGVFGLDMAARFSISNMAIEAGAKFGLFPVDDVTLDYLKEVKANFPDEVRFDLDTVSGLKGMDGDPEGVYSAQIDIDLSEMEPTVALPYLPENALGVYQLREALRPERKSTSDPLGLNRIKGIVDRVTAEGDIPIHQAFIGSCTNGRIEDLRVVADIFKGHRVAPGVRAIIIPASQQVFRQAIKEGLVGTFLEAGCYIESSSCGPCIGIKSGVVGPKETAIFTSNRNFYGRTGDKLSAVILASPSVAAYSALAGRLTSGYGQECYYATEQAVGASLDASLQKSKRVMEALGSAFYQAAIREMDADVSDTPAQKAWCFGDDVNTDLIMPARFCNITSPQDYKVYTLLDTENAEFLSHFKQSRYRLSGDICVAGKNFGCGSSRESAPMGIKEAGFSVVIAHSFARIFFRNALNIGLPVFEIGNAAYQIRQGDEISVEVSLGRIVNHTRREEYAARPSNAFQKSLFESGGLMASLKAVD